MAAYLAGWEYKLGEGILAANPKLSNSIFGVKKT
jgi:hypothetical protein